MKFAIFGNTYQAKKSSHALRLFQLLRRQKSGSMYVQGLFINS